MIGQLHMTQADSAAALRMSLTSEPSSGQGRAREIDATTPLPHGWAPRCSTPDEESPAHWYATAPYNVLTIEDGKAAVLQGLRQTVDADTYIGLVHAVEEQVRLYTRLIKGAE